MKKTLLISLLGISLALVFIACGDSGDKPAAKKETPAKVEKKTEIEDKGVAVAKEILATFDLAWAEVLALVKDKPAAADVKISIREVLTKYSETMKSLNVKYLALKDEDIRLFGSANGYLGEKRGKHVFNKNTAFDTIRYHYQKQEDKDMDGLLHRELINLLELAVKR